KGANDFKLGGTVDATKLDEAFSLGLTDPTLNSPCVDAGGNPSDLTRLTATSQCAGARLFPNPDFLPGVRALDLTRGGKIFNYSQSGTIKTQAFYVQDNIRAGNATFMLGLRADHYNGLSTATLAEPRLGVSFNIS